MTVADKETGANKSGFESSVTKHQKIEISEIDANDGVEILWNYSNIFKPFVPQKDKNYTMLFFVKKIERFEELI